MTTPGIPLGRGDWGWACRFVRWAGDVAFQLAACNFDSREEPSDEPFIKPLATAPHSSREEVRTHDHITETTAPAWQGRYGVVAAIHPAVRDRQRRGAGAGGPGLRSPGPCRGLRCADRC